MNILPLYPPIAHYLSEARKAVAIAPHRAEVLKSIAEAVVSLSAKNGVAELIYICTHNSRRSHMSQLWAQACSHKYGLGDRVRTWSGGTEATAFYPRAVKAMEQAGWLVLDSQGHRLPMHNGYGRPLSIGSRGHVSGRHDNSGYRMGYADAVPHVLCFSKEFKAAPNPAKDFIAVMTCSDIDEACPLVPGAALRYSLPYEDPKAYDAHPDAQQYYNERCRHIAVEMDYLFQSCAEMQATRSTSTHS